MSMLRSRVGVAVTGGKLYAFGGFNGMERLSTVKYPIINRTKFINSIERMNKSIFVAFRSRCTIQRAKYGHREKQ